MKTHSSCTPFIFRFTNRPRHVNDNDGGGRRWDETEDKRDNRRDVELDGNNMISGNTDGYDNLVEIHKSVDDLNCGNIRRFGDN